MGSFARYVTLESTAPGYAAAELAAPKLNTFKAKHRYGLLESDSAQGKAVLVDFRWDAIICL